MKNIAIVEDEKKAVDLVIGFIHRYEQEIYGRKEFNVYHFETPNSFLDDYTMKYELVLLDINLPGINGMEVARELRMIDKKVAIIFVTNMAQYAVKGYEVDALDFIIKPVSYGDFTMKFNRVIKRLDERVESKIPILSQNCTYYIYTADILYIEVHLRKIIFHTTEGEFETYSTLKKLEPILSKECFCKCYRSIMVNLRYVTAVKNEVVCIRDTELLLSRNYRKPLIAALNEYNRSKIDV